MGTMAEHPGGDVPRLQSVYVPISDGTRLAVDVWLPVRLVAAGARVGAILRATRYHRAGAAAGPGPEADANFGAGNMWNQAGFALVLADARGTGASFGTRGTELGVREIADYGELIDWIAAQPWSSGRVGAYGYSYGGDAAELVIRLRNPHLVAVAALFSDFDPYRQLAYPGGAYTEHVLGRWVGANRVYDGVEGALEELAEEAGLPPDVLAGQFQPVKPPAAPTARPCSRRPSLSTRPMRTWPGCCRACRSATTARTAWTGTPWLCRTGGRRSRRPACRS